MTPLDILTPLRPKAEAGRASTGDEAGPRATPGFEAMLDAFEIRPAPTEAGADGKEAEAAPPQLPADPGSGETVTDEAGASLRDLMALTAPVPVGLAPPALPPEAALSAIVQRAAARAGVPAAEAPAPAPRMTLIGIETHFAPVQPRALPGAAATPPVGLALPEQAPFAATANALDAAPLDAATLDAAPLKVPAPAAGSASRVVEPGVPSAPGGSPNAAASPMPTAAPSSAASDTASAAEAEHGAPRRAAAITAPGAPTAHQASAKDAAMPLAERADAATAPRPAVAPPSHDIRPVPTEAPIGDVSTRIPAAPPAPSAVPALQPTPRPIPETTGASIAPEAARRAGSADPLPAQGAAPSEAGAATVSNATAADRSAPAATEAPPSPDVSKPAVAAPSVPSTALPADTAPPSGMPSASITAVAPSHASVEIARARPAVADEAGAVRPHPDGRTISAPAAPPAESTATVQPHDAAPSDIVRLATAAPAVAAAAPRAARGETQRPLDEATTAQEAGAEAAAPHIDHAALAPVPSSATHRAAGERAATAQAGPPPGDAGAKTTSPGAPQPALPENADAAPRALSDEADAGSSKESAAQQRLRDASRPNAVGPSSKDDAPSPAGTQAQAGAMPAVPPSRPEASVAPQRAEQTVGVPPARTETTVAAERTSDESLVTADVSASAEPRAPEAPVPTAAIPPSHAGPSVPASPLRQIVDAVSAQFPAAPPSGAPRTAIPVEAGPLRILTLQLHPADLGTVLVRMRLQDGRLEMNLRTGREETAERLRREGGALSDLLREAGYAPQSLTIEAGGGASLGNASERGSAQNFAAGPQNGQSGGGGADQSPSRRPSREGQEAPPRAQEQDHDSASSTRDRGDLRDRGDRYL